MHVRAPISVVMSVAARCNEILVTLQHLKDWSMTLAKSMSDKILALGHFLTMNI